ncbi:MAG: iron ABC transporter permease [Deltaproteobacteria bacterium]|nr:iron ABC transporter permease [Deltaproteobacteria bacterium]
MAINTYNNFVILQKKKLFTIFILFLFAIVSILIALGSDEEGLSFIPKFSSDMDNKIFLLLRLPRIAMAVLVGAGLAMSGTLAQAILRNPLASPFTLGISSGASFGAAISVFINVMSVWWTIVWAFVFAMATSAIIFGLARIKNSRPETLILGGVAVMFLFGAGTSLLQFLATEFQIQSIVFWGFGNLGRAGWTEVAIAAVCIIPPLPFALRLSWDLNALVLGEETAQALGVNYHALRLKCIALISLMSAAAICFTGLIGFIGLVSPHIARMFLGSEHRYLMPGAILFGVILVSLSDTLSRTIWSPQVVPIGILTSFLGVPFFLWILLRNKKEYWN